MTRRPPSRRALPTAALAVLLGATAAACGIDTTGPVRAGPPASGIPRPGTRAQSTQLYFAGPYGLHAVFRPTGRRLGPQQALDLLLKGPTDAERQRGLVSQVPAMAGQVTATAATGAVDVFVPVAVATGELDVTAVGQLACTAAHAEVPGGRPATRVDIRIHEDYTRSERPWTVRCGPNGNVSPVTG